MKRNGRHLMNRIKLAAIAAALTIVPSFAYAQQPDAVRWGVPMSFGSNLLALGDTMPWVAQELEKVSGGKIKLQVFEPGKLIPALAVYESVSDGKVEAGYTWMGYEVGKLPASALFGAVPFGMESVEFMAWMYFGGGNDCCASCSSRTMSFQFSAAPSVRKRRAGSARRSPTRTS